MTDARHTPEPWEIEKGSMIVGNRIAIKQPHAFDWVASVQVSNMPNYEENARRIVAAVNACQGLSTEALEDGVVGEMIKALECIAYEKLYDTEDPLIGCEESVQRCQEIAADVLARAKQQEPQEPTHADNQT